MHTLSKNEKNAARVIAPVINLGLVWARVYDRIMYNYRVGEDVILMGPDHGVKTRLDDTDKPPSASVSCLPTP